MYIYMYDRDMPKRYSVADARSNLPRILHDVESGSDIELTRRGRSVAVLVSVHKYRRLSSGRPRFAEAYQAFLSRFSLGDCGVDDEFPDSLREKDEGRRVRL